MKGTARLIRDWFQTSLSLIVGCVFAACSGGPTVPDDAVPVQFEEIVGASRAWSGFQDPARLVLQDYNALAAFWAVLEHAYEPKTQPPDIFFDLDIVVVAAMGSRASGGHTIAIEGSFLKDRRLYIVVHESSPGTDCVVVQTQVQPVTAAKIDIEMRHLPIDEFVFVEQSTAVPCAS